MTPKDQTYILVAIIIIVSQSSCHSKWHAFHHVSIVRNNDPAPISLHKDCYCFAQKKNRILCSIPLGASTRPQDIPHIFFTLSRSHFFVVTERSSPVWPTPVPLYSPLVVTQICPGVARKCARDHLVMRSGVCCLVTIE